MTQSENGLWVALDSTGEFVQLFENKPQRVPVGLGTCCVYREGSLAYHICNLKPRLVPDLKPGQCRRVSIVFHDA